MLTADPTPELTPLGNDGYSNHNFAMLHARGTSHLFDTLRYERAFLVRKTDLERLVELAKGNGLDHVNARLSVVLGKFDWRGPTKATWTHERLLSDMELQLADDQGRVYEWAGQVVDFRLKEKLKYRSDIEITGDLPWVLLAMFMNHAMPCDESDAHAIEGAFYKPGEELTVKLTTFVRDNKHRWHLPPK